jgi:hypothetical protein
MVQVHSTSTNVIILVRCSPVQLRSARAKSPTVELPSGWSVMRDRQWCSSSSWQSIGEAVQVQAHCPSHFHELCRRLSAPVGFARSGKRRSSLARPGAPSFSFSCIPHTHLPPSGNLPRRPVRSSSAQPSSPRFVRAATRFKGPSGRFLFVPRMREEETGR